MIFTSTFSRETKLISIIATFIIIIAIFMSSIAVMKTLRFLVPEAVAITIGILAVAPLVLILIIVYLRSPLGYVNINDKEGTLEIGKRYRSLVLHKTDIRSIRQVSDEEKRGMYRLFGSGGWFGWSGSFGSRMLGRFEMIATKRSDLMIIETKAGKRIVFSVDDTKGFVNATRVGDLV